jgi:stage III sporulation protein AB
MLAKFFLGLAIIAFTTFCGYLLSKKYRQKKGFFREFYAFNERFLNEINYFKRPLAEFIKTLDCNGEFSGLLEIFLSGLTLEENTVENTLSGSEFSFLTKEEKTETIAYFSMLGKGDSSSQKVYFSSSKERLKALRDTADSTAKKYADLYIKLGFLCGLLILILIL